MTLHPDVSRLLSTLENPHAAGPAIYHAVHELGRPGATTARRDIERFLTHTDPELRYVALEVLTRHFRLLEHLGTALHFLRHDSSASNRAGAADALLDLKMDTGDRAVLSELANVIRDAAEDAEVREASYAALLGIAHYDPVQQADLSGRDLDFDSDIDWDLVDSYLGDATRPTGGT